jgi:uncharacterized protein
MPEILSGKQKSVLLAIARQAVEAVVRTGKLDVEPSDDNGLNEKRGCFVTIRKNGDLRGCIGVFSSEKPLYREIAEMAVSAATKDPRFHPMVEEDLQNFTIEISVLSPLIETKNPEEIEVGTHGIYLEKGYSRGVLLPQVASEQGWDRTTFLENTCVKAGLPQNAWKAGDTRLYIFSAEIFNDK